VSSCIEPSEYQYYIPDPSDPVTTEPSVVAPEPDPLPVDPNPVTMPHPPQPTPPVIPIIRPPPQKPFVPTTPAEAELSLVHTEPKVVVDIFSSKPSPGKPMASSLRKKFRKQNGFAGRSYGESNDESVAYPPSNLGIRFSNFADFFAC